MKPTRIVIFAKAPAPGFAKTRLIPALGTQGAARLARHMLANALHQALLADVGPVELCATPSFDDPSWHGTAVPAAVQISTQGEGDLGTRLARATQRVIGDGESVLLIGTDCPDLTATRLCFAASKLDEFDAVLYGTADGGYALLGLNHYHPRIFTSIEWGGDTVGFATLCRLGELGWTPYIGETLRDIDTMSDLAYAPPEWLDETVGREITGLHHQTFAANEPPLSNSAISSMQQQHRHFRLTDHVCSDAADQKTANDRVTIGTHDE